MMMMKTPRGAAWHHLLLVIVALSAVQAVLSPPPGYDDDNSPLQLRLEDLERERERERELNQDLEQHFDVNRPPLLPNHYEWRPGVAASLPPSYVQDAAQRERRLEELRQLQRQHQQLSAGYAFPAHLPPSVFYVTGPASASTAEITATSARLLKPIVPYDLDLQLNGIQYLGSNDLPQPLQRPQHQHQHQLQLQLQLQRPPFVYGYTQPPPRLYAARPPPPPPPGLGFQQSKQFAYAPAPQRGYAAGHRIPLPYPPSFISITTRRPSGGYGASHQKPFRPSQPDPTPDLFAGRASKSLLDSYIPSWEVLRLLQQTQPQPQSQSHPYSSHGPVQRHTLAYPVTRPLRLVKRGSERETVKKSLQANV
ncbi:protein enabled homolog [Drosophila guanche]|uniref:protein enabled homolog n=1 Tax=Drosophila guanche TaxID=7266 RepID=UPI001471B49C|nr:protein enabled homolog [Drosophila guanche]